MYWTARFLLVALVLAVASCAATGLGRTAITDAGAPRERSSGPVQVRWADPTTFSELRLSGNRRESARGDWMADLAGHLATRARDALPPGERLEIDITDIRRAGAYEPWRGVDAYDIRFMRDIYPPRVWLTYRRIADDGRVVDGGERALADAMYLSRSGLRSNTDPLRYEKQLLDDWVRREFPRDGA